MSVLLEALSGHCTQSEVFHGNHRRTYQRCSSSCPRCEVWWPVATISHPQWILPTWSMMLMKDCGNPVNNTQDFPDVLYTEPRMLMCLRGSVDSNQTCLFFKSSLLMSICTCRWSLHPSSLPWWMFQTNKEGKRRRERLHYHSLNIFIQPIALFIFMYSLPDRHNCLCYSFISMNKTVRLRSYPAHHVLVTSNIYSKFCFLLVPYIIWRYHSSNYLPQAGTAVHSVI